MNEHQVLPDLNASYFFNGKEISKTKKFLVIRNDAEIFKKRLKEDKDLGKKILKELNDVVSGWIK